MTIEITGYAIQDGIISIFGEDVTEENLMKLERVRDDYDRREVEYRFNTKDSNTAKFFIKWLHSQKATKESTTYGEALRAIRGTVTTINRKSYLVRE